MLCHIKVANGAAFGVSSRIEMEDPQSYGFHVVAWASLEEGGDFHVAMELEMSDSQRLICTFTRDPKFRSAPLVIEE